MEPQKNQDTQTEADKKKRNRRNKAILIIMFFMLVALFLVQCQLDKIKQDELSRKQETQLEAQRRRTLDSLNQLEKMRADSLRILDSLANLNAKDSLQR